MISFIVGWSIGFIVGWVLAIFTEDMDEFRESDPDTEHFIRNKNREYKE